MSFCPSRLNAYNADGVLETVDQYKGDEVDTKKARPCSNADDNIPLLVQSVAAQGRSIAIKSQCDAPIQKVVPSCKVREGFVQMQGEVSSDSGFQNCPSDLKALPLATISSMLSVLHTSLHCLPFAETLGILIYLLGTKPLNL